MESVPCSLSLRAFCKKMVIAASNPPAALSSAKTKLLNLGEGGKVSQPDAGLGKVERRRERVKFQNKGSTRNLMSTPPHFLAFKPARLGLDF